MAQPLRNAPRNGNVLHAGGGPGVVGDVRPSNGNSPDVNPSPGDRDKLQSAGKVIPVPPGERVYVVESENCRYTDESRSAIFSTATVFVYSSVEMIVISKMTPLNYWIPKNQLPPEAENTPPLYAEN